MRQFVSKIRRIYLWSVALGRYYNRDYAEFCALMERMKSLGPAKKYQLAMQGTALILLLKSQEASACFEQALKSEKNRNRINDKYLDLYCLQYLHIIKFQVYDVELQRNISTLAPSAHVAKSLPMPDVGAVPASTVQIDRQVT